MRWSLTAAVVGGRNYTDKRFVFRTLYLLRAECRELTLIDGGHRNGKDTGVDYFAMLFGQEQYRFCEHLTQRCICGYHVPIPDVCMDTSGNIPRPGFKSRVQCFENMIEDHFPELLLVFPGGKETRNCLAKAKELQLGEYPMEIREVAPDNGAWPNIS